MRKTCLNMIQDLADADERVVFIGSDLGAGTLERFRQTHPARFIMEGVSEANIVSMAAGLALCGRIPYVNTIAPFLTRRVYEQVMLDLGMHRTRVRLIGNGGGLVYAPLGSTHLAFDDIALMRAVPNMTIIAPADAGEMQRFMPHSLDHPGPIYIRLAKGGDPIVAPDREFRIGRGVPVREGGDALIVTTGITLKLAIAAAERLAGEGIAAGILHLPTVKPLDTGTILDWAAGVRAVVTVEEHSLVGGLGSAVAELLLEHASAVPAFGRIGLPDTFPDQYGSQDSLMQRYGITTDAIVVRLQELLEGRPAATPPGQLYGSQQ